MMHKTTLFLLLAALVGGCGDDKKTPADAVAESLEDMAKTIQVVDRTIVSVTTKKGLQWLRSQAKDGIWMGPDGRGGMAPSVAFTALAVTPIAAALPEDERAKDPLVIKAAEFIVRNLQEDGAVRQGPASKYDNYFTSTSLMALETIGHPAHADVRKRMRDFILSLQRQEEGRIKGGIGYNTAGNADLSNSQFAIEALRAAGIGEEHPAMQQALKYLQRVQNRSENEENKGAVYEMKDEKGEPIKVVPGNDGSAGYEPGVSKAGMHRLPDGTYMPRGYGSMTYALLKCYILVGLEPDDARVKAVIDWLGKHYTWDQNPGFEEVSKFKADAPYWGLYYYYMTAAKALRLTGIDTIDTPDGPKDWRAGLEKALVARQQADGSWKNDKSKRWDEALPVITTSYALIALQEIRASR